MHFLEKQFSLVNAKFVAIILVGLFLYYINMNNTGFPRLNNIEIKKFEGCYKLNDNSIVIKNNEININNKLIINDIKFENIKGKNAFLIKYDISYDDKQNTVVIVNKPDYYNYFFDLDNAHRNAISITLYGNGSSYIFKKLNCSL